MRRTIHSLAALAAAAGGSAAVAGKPLLPDGVQISAGAVSESAWNAQGGDRERVRQTGQLTLGATIDTDKVIGLEGGTLQATVTYRWGDDLGPAAGLGTLQQVQEVYGRGQTWRLTQLWYQQELAGGRADIKLGRTTVGEDFASFRCSFMNLTFCGAQPGNLVGDYWYNWPVSQWAARVRVKGRNRYAQVGVYEVNPRNLEKDFGIGRFHGASGVLIPVEFGWTPAVSGLPGSYKIGGWYETSGGNDLFEDVNHQPLALTGAAPRKIGGRHGVYLLAQQQVTGTARDGQTKSGLTLFVNVTQADKKTARTDSQSSAGMFWLGPLRGRPDDEIGLALGRTHVNAGVARGLRLAEPGAPTPGSEYASELYYSYHVADWISLQPNVQLIIHPGGYHDRKNTLIGGLKASLSLAPFL